MKNKKQYEKPSIEKHGSIKAITRAGGGTLATDMVNYYSD